jgi:G3E family GTPase
VAAIEKLMQKKGAFDHILLETTGLADPGGFSNNFYGVLYLITSYLLGPIASMFWLNEEYAAGLAREIVLDGVVCVVDAVFGKKVQHEFYGLDFFTKLHPSKWRKTIPSTALVKASGNRLYLQCGLLLTASPDR